MTNILDNLKMGLLTVSIFILIPYGILFCLFKLSKTWNQKEKKNQQHYI
jgi:hypothetical protein